MESVFVLIREVSRDSVQCAVIEGLHDAVQFVYADGFLHHALHADLDALLQSRGVVVGRDCYDGHVVFQRQTMTLVVAEYVARRVEPVHLRHVQVSQDQPVPYVAAHFFVVVDEGVDFLNAIFDQVACDAVVLLQDAFEGQEVEGVVVSQEHRRFAAADVRCVFI